MESSTKQHMSVRTLLKLRPLAIGLLGKHKVRFWDALDKPVREVFQKDRVDAFLEEVSYARIPAHDTDWSAMPLYVLVDYLTHQHCTLFIEEISDIAHLLNIHCLAEAGETPYLKAWQSLFDAFVVDFERHIDAEETGLFPKILRYEACLQDRFVHPEFHRGSLQAYASTPQARADQKLQQDAGMLMAKLANLESQFPDSTVVKKLADLIRSLRDKLSEHADKTSQILLAAGCEMERSLYNMTIDGDPAMAVRSRGPMDSGIMRLNLG